MINVAVLGYGTVGAGVVEVLTINKETITPRVGDEVNVRYVLDLRDFPGSSIENILTHDYNDILQDESVDIVVETMGGVHPAYEFSKQALQAGKNVCTSNKELVAEHGVELCQLALENNVNYMFEASCGGGIPIIRTINTSLTADKIEKVSGILNGTTNYILTSMLNEKKSFEDALKEAQDKGYAELHPEADVEGHDAQRKIAILSSLAYNKHIAYTDVPTEGITNIDVVDIKYAKAMDLKIKLLATSTVTEKGTWAMVAPMLVGKENELSMVDGVMNAVFVRGNALGDSMYYGSGAGSLPTASAVCGDVLDCARNLHVTLKKNITSERLELLPIDDVVNQFFVRTSADEETINKVFNPEVIVSLPDEENEFGFWTNEMTEAEFTKKCEEARNIIKFIRRG